MESILLPSNEINEGDSLAVIGYYTEVRTDVMWEMTTVNEQVFTDQWNATFSPMTKTPDGEYNVTHVVLASVALLVIDLAVITGNILVLLAVYCERALRTVTNYFIVNLAIADLLLGTLVLPFSSAFEVIHYWPFGEAFCDIWAAVDVLCCTASINSLCCISVDRYIGVTKPLKHRLIMTPRRAIMINVFVWLISFGIAVGPLFGWRPVKTSRLECPLSDSVGYVFFSVAGSFYIPSTIILVLYFRIYRAVSRETKSIQDRSRRRYGNTESGHDGDDRVILRIHVGNGRQYLGKYNRRSRSLPSGSSRSRNMSQRTATFNREKKVAKTLGIVVGVFIICWLPFFFLLPLTSICSSCQLPEGVFTFFFWLGYCNSCVNPVIYAMSNLTFRRAFRKILTCWYCRDRRSLRRTFGSRRSSNVSRLTSSTPVSSPMVTSRNKRMTHDTPSQMSAAWNEYRSGKGSSHQANGGLNNEVDCHTQYEADGCKQNAHTKIGEHVVDNRCESVYGRMLTNESESATDNNLITETCYQRVPNDNTDTLSHVLKGVQEPPRMTVSRLSSSNCFRQKTNQTQRAWERLDCKIVEINTTFTSKPLTDQELSSGIHHSKETSV